MGILIDPSICLGILNYCSFRVENVWQRDGAGGSEGYCDYEEADLRQELHAKDRERYEREK
jgi:hypothetical protein